MSIIALGHTVSEAFLKDYRNWWYRKYMIEKYWKEKSEAEKKARIEALQEKSPIPEPLRWIPGVITALDDAQDVLISALYLGKLVVETIPNPIAKTIGIALTASDVSNVAVAAMGRAMMPLSRKGRLRQELGEIGTNVKDLEKYGREFMESDFSNRQRLGFGLQSAQALDTIAGSGMVLGNWMGLISEFQYAVIKDLMVGAKTGYTAINYGIRRVLGGDKMLSHQQIHNYYRGVERPVYTETEKVLEKFRHNWRDMLRDTFYGVLKGFGLKPRKSPPIMTFSEQCYNFLWQAPLLWRVSPWLQYEELEMLLMAQSCASIEVTKYPVSSFEMNRINNTTNSLCPMPSFPPYYADSRRILEEMGYNLDIENMHPPSTVEYPCIEDFSVECIENMSQIIAGIRNTLEVHPLGIDYAAMWSWYFLNVGAAMIEWQCDFNLRSLVGQEREIASAVLLTEYDIALGPEHNEYDILPWLTKTLQFADLGGRRMPSSKDFLDAGASLGYNIVNRW